jgi:hypothetical protein
MGIAYDAARGVVVLFGGYDNGSPLGDTWTWDGTDWTKRHPVHAPSARLGSGMAYDAARAKVVLFGGSHDWPHHLSDTWTWDGTDWTEAHHTNRPPGLYAMGMAYDAARGLVVMFGGQATGYTDRTWTWDGAVWSRKRPLHSPPARYFDSLAYDAARDRVVLFGGENADRAYNDTWTWDGMDWTSLAPRHVPEARGAPGMAFDPGDGRVLMFGGGAIDHYTKFGDTWEWNDRDWRVPIRAALSLNPKSGPPGSAVDVSGSGFGGLEHVTLSFIDSANGVTRLGVVTTDGTGSFATTVMIPSDATLGDQAIRAVGQDSGQSRRKTFTVT